MMLLECVMTAAVTATFSVLVGEHDKTIHINTYNWTDHFSSLGFRSIPNILDYHHFRMSIEDPGIVNCFKGLDEEEQPFKVRILKSIPSNTNLPSEFKSLPSVVPPKGFTEARKQYLYYEIRQFCIPGTEDYVAPLPE